MSFSQYLRQLGQPIAYYPQLAKPLGGVTAAVLFGQLFYWQDKTDNPLGVYKTLDELMEETGLTERELRSAREKLRELGVIIETNKRLEHRLYFKVDYNALDDLMALWSFREESKRHSTNGQNVIPPNDKTSFREESKRHSVNTKTTTKITTENTSDLSTSQQAAPSRRTNKFSDDDLRTAQWILGLLQKLNPNIKTPNLDTWANEVRLMNKVDNRSHREICELFQWANRDPFWQANILSPKKLREKWDQLVMKKSSTAGRSAVTGTGDWNTAEGWAEVI